MNDSIPGARADWWRDAVIYQIYPRSFADGDGDGIGDLPGAIARLDHLRDLGVDAVWLSPFYPSPQHDAGYDVADYCAVDPLFGTLADADRLIVEAHARGLRVLVDLVPNHTSDEHVWFRAAIAAAEGSPERARYLFRDGRGPGGDAPPNNWRSVFGGDAWTRVPRPDGTPGQWYLHLFDVHQPDLDWTNPEVHAEFERVLRFWLDRGVDGFRVDVTHGMVKAPGLPDWNASPSGIVAEKAGRRPPMWDQDGVHDILRGWHELLATYGEDRILCAEAWVSPPERLARYVRPDEMQQAFNFEYLKAPWEAARLQRVMVESIDAMAAVDAPPTWVLSNHDVVRHVSRLGLPDGVSSDGGIGIGDVQPDRALGLRRGRAATLLILALPGVSYVYQGEEFGLPEHTELPDGVRQDPTYLRSGGRERGRDGCRVPIAWEADAPAYGFSPNGASWLPQPADWAPYAADSQRGVAGSTYEMYREALSLRRRFELGRGKIEIQTSYGEGVVSYCNGDVTVVATVGSATAVLPPAATVLLASGPVDDGVVPADTTVWFTTD
ncbi:MAG: alpha-glucosidase [Frankiaceae bacterium]|nr:alpha-glucosidase [Frankiaceae bacterium]